jgi:ribosome-binding ATPase YchF (GTP1/OBG family)
VGTSAVAHGSPPHASPARTRAPPAHRHPPSAAPESSRDATHRGKKQNILVKGLKSLISMCRSNDAHIRESHQHMSQRLSHLEERQHEISSSMGFAIIEPIVYDGEDDDEDDDDYEIKEESE